MDQLGHPDPCSIAGYMAVSECLSKSVLGLLLTQPDEPKERNELQVTHTSYSLQTTTCRCQSKLKLHVEKLQKQSSSQHLSHHQSTAPNSNASTPGSFSSDQLHHHHHYSDSVVTATQDNHTHPHLPQTYPTNYNSINNNNTHNPTNNNDTHTFNPTINGSSGNVVYSSNPSCSYSSDSSHMTTTNSSGTVLGYSDSMSSRRFSIHGGTTQHVHAVPLRGSLSLPGSKMTPGTYSFNPPAPTYAQEFFGSAQCGSVNYHSKGSCSSSSSIADSQSYSQHNLQ